MSKEAIASPPPDLSLKNGRALLLAGGVLALAFLTGVYISMFLALLIGVVAAAAPYWRLDRGLVLFVAATLLWPHMLAWRLGPWIWDPSRAIFTLLFLTWVVALMRGQVKLSKTPLDLAFLMLAGVMLLSIVVNNPGMNSEQNGRTLKTFGTDVVEWGLLYYLVTSIIKDWFQARKIVSIIAALLVVVALAGVIEYITGFRVYEWFRHYLPGGENMISNVHEFELENRYIGYQRGDVLRIVSTTMSYQEVGTLMAMAIPLIMYLLAYARKWPWALFWAGSLVPVVSALFLSVTRGAIIAAAAAIICTSLFSHRGVLRAAFMPILVVSLIVFLLFPSIPGAILSVSASSALPQESSLQGRFKDWPEAGKLLRDHELLGVGPGLVTGHLLDYGGVVSSDFRVTDNWYLATTTEMGALGIGALLILWGAMFTFLLRGRKQSGSLVHGVRDLRIAILSSGVAFMIMCFTFDAGVFVTISKMFFLLIGLGVVVARAD